MSNSTIIHCEGLLKGNADLEDGPQEALRAALALRAAGLFFDSSVSQKAFDKAVAQYVNQQQNLLVSKRSV